GLRVVSAQRSARLRSRLRETGGIRGIARSPITGTVRSGARTIAAWIAARRAGVPCETGAGGLVASGDGTFGWVRRSGGGGGGAARISGCPEGSIGRSAAQDRSRRGAVEPWRSRSCLGFLRCDVGGGREAPAGSEDRRRTGAEDGAQGSRTGDR